MSQNHHETETPASTPNQPSDSRVFGALIVPASTEVRKLRISIDPQDIAGYYERLNGVEEAILHILSHIDQYQTPTEIYRDLVAQLVADPEKRNALDEDEQALSDLIELAQENDQQDPYLDRMRQSLTISSKVHAARELYEHSFWDEFGVKDARLDTDLLGELYDDTDVFEESGLLSSIRMISDKPIHEDFTHELDRVSRVFLDDIAANYPID